MILFLITPSIVNNNTIDLIDQLNKKTDIVELMPAIKTVYQMEQEFKPYLIVNFLPSTDKNNENNNKDNTKIILSVADEKIHKNYNFNDENDVAKLRELLWEYLLKYHNIKKINEYPDGSIKNFMKVGTNKIIESYSPNLNLYPKLYSIKQPLYRYYGNDKQTSINKIKHPVYRYNGNNEQTFKSCMNNRFEECKINYPLNTPLFRKCIIEGDKMCNNDYSMQNKKDQYNDEAKNLYENFSNLDKTYQSYIYVSFIILCLIIFIIYIRNNIYY